MMTDQANTILLSSVHGILIITVMELSPWTDRSEALRNGRDRREAVRWPTESV
jgi:hypothetical protein